MACGTQRRLVDMQNGVHGVPDGNAACLDTVGQELAELAVQIQCSNPEQGREELCPDCHLQLGKVSGRVRRHALHVLPLVLQAEGESGVSSLWIVTGQEGQRFYCATHVVTMLPSQSILLALLPMKPPKYLCPQEYWMSRLFALNAC